MKAVLDNHKTFTKKFDHKTYKIGKFTLKEFYEDDKLVGQEWLTLKEKMNYFSFAYEPKHIMFKHYDDISFLSKLIDGNHDYLNDVKNTFADVNNIDLSHVICNYIHMDGTIFNLLTCEPIALWRKKDYIGGITNRDYNLEKVLNKMQKCNFIRNASIERIPYYNSEENKTEYIEFEYYSKLPMMSMYEVNNCIRSKKDIILEL